MRVLRFFALATSLIALVINASAQAEADHDADHGAQHEMSYSDQVMHHIADANEFHVIGDLHIPLPVIAWSKNGGLFTGWSSQFYLDHGASHDAHAPAGDTHNHEGHGHEGHGHDTHGHEGHGHEAHAAAGHGGSKVINGYFLDHGVLMRLSDPSAQVAQIDAVEMRQGPEGESIKVALAGGQLFAVEDSASLLKMTNWIDFSITKNVFTMFMAVLIFALIFIPVRRAYDRNAGKAPSGIQSFFEPIILFVRDDIAKQMIGAKWERYFPYLCTLFFFILIINLIGLIPVAPFGSNVTGNLGLTMVLAVITFLVVNFSGNRDYWGHIFWMPGVPFALKPVMAVIEFLGIFIKPFTLMIRLFANITAGHIIILSLIGLIFLFGNNGQSVGGSVMGAALAVPFVFVMNLLEIFVAFLQAFIFTLLSALYIGAAVEEHHHADHAPHVPA